MSIGDKLSEKLSSFEKYNNKELYHLGSVNLGFTVTGRIVSGTFGFIVIILMLMVTFSSAANSIMVSELGGTKAFTADVSLTEVSGTTISGTLNNEGEFIKASNLTEHFNMKRISRYKPSPTITASGGCIHWSEMRKLALCETQRVMSLPDDFKLTGKWEQKSERMGRMVPPLMMKAIADAVYERVLKPYKEIQNG